MLVWRWLGRGLVMAKCWLGGGPAMNQLWFDGGQVVAQGVVWGLLGGVPKLLGGGLWWLDGVPTVVRGWVGASPLWLDSGSAIAQC
jgi:hypothetical protein